MAIAPEHRASFEELGYAAIRGALPRETCEELKQVLARLEDPARLSPGESVFRNAEEVRGAGDGSALTTFGDHQLRLSSPQRRDAAFHVLIDHPAILPFLEEYMRVPRLRGDWYIRKERGPRSSWWHRGHGPCDGLRPVAEHAEGKIATRYINVAWLLDDQGAGEGCLLCVPGSHALGGDFLTKNKASYDHPGLALEGSIELEGRAGDVVVFTEALIHCGDEKLRGSSRRNLYMLYEDRAAGAAAGAGEDAGATEAEEQATAMRGQGPLGDLWPLLKSEPARQLCSVGSETSAGHGDVDGPPLLVGGPKL